MPQRKSKILYHKQNYNDSTVFIRKDRFRYAISISDSSMSYTYKNTKPVNIYKIDGNRFYMQRKRKEREYIKRDNHVVLGKTFHIHLSDDRKSIIINSPWREQQNKNPILTIQKDDNRIFIFSKSYRGKKIEFTENGFLVTGTHVKPTLYKKSSSSENLSTVSTAYK